MGKMGSALVNYLWSTDILLRHYEINSMPEEYGGGHVVEVLSVNCALLTKILCAKRYPK